VQQRQHQLVDELRPEQALPGAAVAAQARGRGVDVALHCGRRPVVERVRERQLRPAPLDVQAAQRGGIHAERVRRRAVVVQQAGRQLTRARAATDGVRSLEHGHPDAVARELDGAGEPVGPGADDDGVRHAAWTGNAGFDDPSSHGSWETMSSIST
jgi:hypothetical protein